jgi:hypothetical protein|tara:strand:+ start:7355 stop:8620 length:1266 start_codon:yes stop_codon:yes gene_type:complete
MKIKHTLLAFTLLLSANIMGQFTLEGEFRPRTELFNNGFNYRYQPAAATPPGNLSGREGSSAYLSTSVRAAINATYTTESYTMYLGFQEVFDFGDRTQISAASNGNFRVQEAWAAIKLSELWSFKVGRQPLSYDDQRILGGLAWAQQARTHDVGVLKYKNAGYAIDAGYSLNTTGSNTYGDHIYGTAALFSYRELAFIHANKKFGKLNLSALLLNTTFQAGTEDQSSLVTAGIHAKIKFGKLGLAFNGYVQDGERIGNIAVKGAYLTSLDATFAATAKIILLAGSEIISGTQDNTAAFFPLYGTNHKFNGLMDRFYVGNHAIGSGLIDFNFGAKFKLPKGYNLMTKFHYFKEESRSKNTLGQEVDFVIAKKYKGYSIVGGYSHFFEDDSFPNPAGNPVANSTQNWAWLMLTIKPKFLNTIK